MLKTINVAVLIVALLALLVSGSGYARSVAQPEPAGPGAAAPAIEVAYQAIQSAPTLAEEAKVQAAVDTYFALHYDSLMGGKALDLEIVVDKEDTGGKDLCNYQMGRLQFFLAAWKLTGVCHTGKYTYHPEYLVTQVSGNTARVELHPWANIDANPPFETGGENHVVTLTRTARGWRIIGDDYRDEFTDLYPRGTDFATLIRTLPNDLTRFEAEQRAMADVVPGTSAATGDAGILTYRTYDGGNAAWYGKTFTSESSGQSSYNPLFRHDDAADCQNFVSQCIWCGFGGLNISTYIQNHSLPMIDGWPGANLWWEDSANASYESSTGWWSWTYVPHFKDMILGNYASDKTGVQATYGTLTTEDCNCDYGDYVATYPSWGHVLIVVSLPDGDADLKHDYNEIRISAHTTNHLNYPLQWIYASPTALRLLRIVRFKNPN